MTKSVLIAMTKWGLVADLRSSGLRLCVVSSSTLAVTPDCIADAVGRGLLPLDSPSLWPEDHAAALSVRERIRWLTALVTDEDPQRSEDLDAANRNTMSLLAQGLTQLAEAHLQRTVKATAVLLPAPVSGLYRELFREEDNPLMVSHASVALYAYELNQLYMDRDDFGYAVITDVDASTVTATIVKVYDGYYETLQSSRASMHNGVHAAVSSVLYGVCMQHNLTLTDLNEVVFMGEVDDVMLEEVTETVNALVPEANLHKSIPPREMAIRGATMMMQQVLKWPVAMCSLAPSLVTISVRVKESLAWPLVSRYSIMPTARRARLRVNMPMPNTTIQTPAGPDLQFFDGESAFAYDNTLLGSMRTPSLAAGWNDIDVDAHLGDDHVLRVRASQALKEERCSQAIELQVSSTVAGMTMEELAEYSLSQDNLAFLTDKEARIDQLRSQDFIRTAYELLQRELPRELVHAGELVPKNHRASVCLSKITKDHLATFLNEVNWSKREAFDSGSVRAAIVELIGEAAVYEVHGSWS